MKKLLTLVFLSMIAFNAIHAEITWTLSDNGTLTISGTNMQNYGYDNIPWYSQRYSIKKVVIEKGVTNIGTYAFYDCPSLTSITIPNTVTNIGMFAFRNCSELNSITIPNSVTIIGKEAFEKCSRLTSITIPNSVTSIGEGAFCECSGLTSVTIPNSVTSIGEMAFSGCSGLTSVTIPNSVTSIGKWSFLYCSGLTSITISNSVTSIGESAFEGCSGLTSITIPESVKVIEIGAFQKCSKLTSITIPKSVTNIGSYVFWNCLNLKSITCEATIPPSCNSGCFDSIKKYIPVYVPTNSINAYKEAIQWKEFTNILSISVDPTLALTLTDKSADLTKGYYQKGKVTFTRNNMSVGDYATFCLPFDIDLSKMTDVFSKVYLPLNIGLLKPSGTLLMLLDEVNNNTIIKAGQTFVAKCLKSEVVFENCSDVTFDDSTPNPTPSKVKIYNFDGTSGALTQNTDVNLKIGGTYSNLTKLDKNNYRVLFANGSFDSTTSVTPFQMYVYIDDSSLGSKVTSISFDFNDEATGIKELRMNNDKSSVYDLNGRMMNEKNLKPGLYIKNGKKIVIN
jgi:hypothetical protein